MRTISVPSVLACLVLGWLTCHAQSAPVARTVDFEDGKLDGWQVTGDAAVTGVKVHGGTKALLIPPKAEAVLQATQRDGFGKVEMWVYDSGYARQGDAAKERVFGPLWGLINSRGDRLCFGLIWAPYLDGNSGYGYISTAENAWGNRRYARMQRAEGWRRWEFQVNNEGEVKAFCDGREATGFDVLSSMFHYGYSGVYFRGSRETDEPLYVDDIRIAWQPERLTPLHVAVAGLTPAPPEAPPLAFRQELVGKHPHLFFAAADIPAIRERCKTTHKKFYDRLISGANSYLQQMPPESMADMGDDQLMQQWGWWRLQTLAFAYIASGDQRYGEHAKKWVLRYVGHPNWGTGEETNASMGAANMLTGVACAYDWCYDLFSESERELVRKKLLKQVVDMCWLGFERLDVNGYWKSDPQNNHLHHRLSGLALGALAIYGEVQDADKYAAYAAQKARWVHQWLAPDGSSHEGPGYQAFGHSYVVRVLDALRHTAGVDLLTGSHLLKTPLFRAHMLTPGSKSVFNFGDGSPGAHYFNHYQFKLVSVAQDGRLQMLMDRAYEAAPESFMYYPWCVLWYDANLKPAPLNDLPTWAYFDDIEIATYRSSWDDPNALAVLLKCGPYGGHKLNQYMKEEKKGWVNVAHDHPDAQHFMVFANGEFWARDDGYPKQNKSTENHNCLMVDGQGMAQRGTGWLQPVSGQEKMGRMDEVFGSPGYFAARGDATQYYKALNGFFRWFVVVDDAYVVVADQLEATGNHQFKWLYHCDGNWESGPDGRYIIRKGEKSFVVHVVSPSGAACNVSDDVLEGRTRGKVLTIEKAGGTPAPRLVLLLVPDARRAAQLQPKVTELDGGVELRVARGGVEDILLFNDRAEPLRGGEVELDGKAAIVHMMGGQVGEALLLGGRRLLVGGKAVLEASKPVNLRSRATEKGRILWASVSTGTEPGDTEVIVGAQQPGATYLARPGDATTKAQVDAEGRAKVVLPLGTATKEFWVGP